MSAQGDDWVSSTLERIEIPLCGVLNPHDGAAAPFELVITAGSELRNAIGLLDLARDQFGVNDPRRTALSALSEIYEQVEESEYNSAKFPMEIYYSKNALKHIQSGCIMAHGDRMLNQEHLEKQRTWAEVVDLYERNSKNAPGIVYVVQMNKNLVSRLQVLDVTPRRTPKTAGAGSGGGGRGGGAPAGGFASDDDDDDDEDDEGEKNDDEKNDDDDDKNDEDNDDDDKNDDDDDHAGVPAPEGGGQGFKNAADEDNEGAFTVGNAGASETPLPAAKSESRLTRRDPRAAAAAEPLPAPGPNTRLKRNAPKKYRE